MPSYSNLMLVSPDNFDAPAENLPANVPVSVERAGLYINHGAAVGDLLGVDTQPLIDVYNEIYNREDDAGDADVLIHTDQLPVLIAGLAEIRSRLDHAIDTEGKPQPNAGGRSLAASSLIETDEIFSNRVTCISSIYANIWTRW
jgi:hypothetical protein